MALALLERRGGLTPPNPFQQEHGPVENSQVAAFLEEIADLLELKGANLQIDLRVVQPEVYGAALQHFTGSKQHNIALREIANGLSVERLEERLAEIERLNERVAPFRILTSTEVDILRDGSLDYPDELLARLDLVVASVHTSFKMDREQMTERIVRALRNPHVDVLGHPTGRLLLRRDPYELDLDKVIEEAAGHGLVLEINAFPDRMDLDDVWSRHAQEQGAMLCISTDAHAPDHLTYMRYGVAVARRAWLEKKDVLNALPLGALLTKLRARGHPLPNAA